MPAQCHRRVDVYVQECVVLSHQDGGQEVAHFSLNRLLLLGLGDLSRGRRNGAALSPHHGVARCAEMGSVMLHAVVLTGEPRSASLVGALVVLLAGVDAHVSGQVSRGGERPATVAHVLLSLLVVHIVEVDVHNGHSLGLVQRRRLGQRRSHILRSMLLHMLMRHGHGGRWWWGSLMDHLGLRLVVVHGRSGRVVDVPDGRQWTLVVEDVFERHGESCVRLRVVDLSVEGRLGVLYIVVLPGPYRDKGGSLQ